MRRARIVAGYVCAMAMASCGSSDPQSGSYVLLDPEARQAGLSIEMNEQAVTSALPVAVAAGAKVTLVGPEENEPLAIGAGEVVYVQGAHATVSHLRLGKQIEPNDLRILGDAHAASDLASQLGGNVESTAGELHLHSSDVFAIVAGAHVPESLLGVAPVLLSTTTAPAAAAHAGPAPVAAVAAVAERGTTSPLRVAAPLVAAPMATALPDVDAPAARVQTSLPIAFAPAAACTGSSGTWRGRAYSEPHGAYYDFTLRVTESGGSVRGNVTAEFWTASTDEVAPPQACSGAQHVKVFESGTGTVNASGALHFASKSWRVSNHVCGPRVTAYSPDRFDVPLASGGNVSDALLSDDMVWTNGLPVKLTRVSCQ